MKIKLHSVLFSNNTEIVIGIFFFLGFSSWTIEILNAYGMGDCKRINSMSKGKVQDSLLIMRHKNTF